MAVLPILTLPDPLLRRRSAPVGAMTERVRRLAADMLDTMYDAPGVGLAAIQVGVPLRLVVADVGPKDGPRAPMVLVDPEVVAASAETRSYEEGCLSIPDHTGEVTRPQRVSVRYRDLEGAPREVAADGLLATCLQHEIDHLDGRLFIDHLSRVRRDLIARKYAKEARQARG